MALIKCKECGKAVSDKASSCPACGNPISGSGSVSGSAFERRIEEYKSNGYVLQKRDGDTAVMCCSNKSKYYPKSQTRLYNLVIALTFVFALLFMIILVLFNWILGAVLMIFLIVCIFSFMNSIQSKVRVSITLRKDNKIEEIGFVLK